MKKRVISATLALCLTLSLLCTGAGAASTGTKAETLRALGIVSGETAEGQVTRARFAQMLTEASAWKDSVESCGASLFKDLKGDHWASGYVRIAVEQGWMSGYVDGSFRPDQPITLEEGCTALLKVLGYDLSTLKGADARLSRARSIGLLEDVSAKQGSKLTEEDCVGLFYNLLTSLTSSGTVYGTTLGCTVTGGEVDYSALVASGLKGPFTAAADGTLELPFLSDQRMILFYNGAPSKQSAVKQYDIYYYNENVRTVWVYNDRVVGTLNEIAPDQIAPESVTVAGQTYQLENQALSQKVSGLEEGEVVTLLLGKDGKAADILQGVHGELDDDDYIAVVNSDTKGPYVAASNTLELPFDGSQASVYRNGSLSSLSSVQQYDVYYYNTVLQTVWVYSDRVTGTLTSVLPNQAAPTSVTVAGVSYEIGTSEASYQFSSQGSFREGDMVTILLGMNGEVVRVVEATEDEVIYYGCVVSSEKNSSLDTSTGSAQVTTKVACTDGVVRTFYHKSTTQSVGRLVSVSTTQSGTEFGRFSSRSLTGTVSKDGACVGSYKFADGAQILDTDDNGGYARIYPGRLAGCRLSGSDVQGYTLNADGEIDRMILRNVTGDTMEYVYVTNIEDNSSGMNISVSYTYLRSGQSQTVSGKAKYAVKGGGAMLNYEKGSLKSIRQLSSVSLDSLSTLSAMGGGKEYKLAEDVQVLIRDGSSYYLAGLDQVNGGDYKLTGWYDSLNYSAGGRIRIIVAASTIS